MEPMQVCISVKKDKLTYLYAGIAVKQLNGMS